MRDDVQRLHDIFEAIERIDRHAAKGRDAFVTDELLQTWFSHHLQIIGEAARGLSKLFRDKNPEVPWQKIIGMRNVLVHGYFGIDRDVVWEVVERDMPALKENIARMLSQSENNNP